MRVLPQKVSKPPRQPFSIRKAIPPGGHPEVRRPIQYFKRAEFSHIHRYKRWYDQATTQPFG